MAGNPSLFDVVPLQTCFGDQTSLTGQKSCSVSRVIVTWGRLCWDVSIPRQKLESRCCFAIVVPTLKKRVVPLVVIGTAW